MQSLSDDAPPRPAFRDPLLRSLAIATLVLAIFGVLWFVTALFDRVHNTMVVLILSVLFAYVVYPPIKWLAKRNVPPAIGGAIVYAGLAIVILGAIAWLTPAIASQASELSHNYPHLVAVAQNQLQDPEHAPLLAKFPESVRTTIAANAGKGAAFVAGFAGSFGTRALSILSGTTAVLVNLSLILGITLIMISELAVIQSFGVRLVPRKHRASAISFMAEVDTVIGGFVRGQVLLALTVAIAGTIVLTLMGVPYAVLIGLIAGIVSIIPLVGPVLAFIPVVAIGFFTVGLTKTIIVGVLFAIIIGVQQNVLVPIFVAKSVGISALTIFVALLMGSEAFGMLGALLSIPIAGILRVAAERLFPEDTEADNQLIAARDASGEDHAQSVASIKNTGADKT